jgi:hypothetical protein
MAFFDTLRPLVRIGSELRRIANALEYFAVANAQETGRMYIRKGKPGSKDESELIDTNRQQLREQQDAEEQRVTEYGWLGNDNG